jgi:excisionase family DNA binding protein
MPTSRSPLGAGLSATGSGPGATPQLLLSVPEAARALGIARSTLYVLLERGELVSVSIGHRRLLPARALDDYVEHLMASARGCHRGTPSEGAPGARAAPGRRRKPASAVREGLLPFTVPTRA